MKVQCDLCREIVVAELAIRGDRVEVHCPSCDGRFEVATIGAGAPAEPASPAPPIARVKFARAPTPLPEAYDGPTMACPKCGLVQRPADACRACGLRASKMASFTASEEASAPAEVTAAWAACERAWSDPEAHETVARVASAAGSLAWLARRYRERLRKRPDDDVAAARLAALTRMTEATLKAAATARAEGTPGKGGGGRPYRSATMILLMLVLLAAAGTVYALVTAPAEEAPAEPIPIPVKPGH